MCFRRASRFDDPDARVAGKCWTEPIRELERILNLVIHMMGHNRDVNPINWELGIPGRPQNQGNRSNPFPLQAIAEVLQIIRLNILGINGCGRPQSPCKSYCVITVPGSNIRHPRAWCDCQTVHDLRGFSLGISTGLIEVLGRDNRRDRAEGAGKWELADWSL